MGFIGGSWEEEDAKWDHEQYEYRVINAYPKIKEKNPKHPLLKFGEIKTKGLIFKHKYFEFSDENHEEYLKKYGNKKGERYPMPIEKYASDLEKALKKSIDFL